MIVAWSLLKVLLFLPVFLILSVFVFYIPGYLLIRSTAEKLRSDEKIVLGFSLGIILFLILGSIASVLGFKAAIPLVLIFANFYALLKFRLKPLDSFLKIAREKLLFLFLAIGTLVEGIINFPSGFSYPNGHLYWSAQGHDGLWHIAIIEAIKKGFPPDNPLFTGVKLFNYHFFVDIIIAFFNNLFPFFNLLDLYFRDFSFLISFLMGLAAYSFLTTWRKDKKVGLLGIFFTYFVGSFGYLVLAIQGRGFFGGETIFWTAQGNTIIGNPPLAFCYVLIPSFFLAFHYFLKQKNLSFFLACFLLGGFLLGFKVSAAFVLLAGLGLTTVYNFLFKKQKKLLLLTSLIALSNFIIFKLITRQGESFLLFLPWWFIRTMVVVPDRLNWLDLELRRQFYAAQGGIRSLIRIAQFETTAFLIFLVGNLGTRIVGFREIAKTFVKSTILKSPLETTLFFTMLTGFLMPILFVQRGVTYNLIQFMQFFLLIFGFFAAVSLNDMLTKIKSKGYKIIFLVAFFLLSIPTVIGNLLDFYGKNPLAIITTQELQALSFLKSVSLEKDIILTRPFNPYSHGLYKNQPWPIYAWGSTAYVSAYIEKQTYYTDEGQMRILGIDTEERLRKMNAFFDKETSLTTKETFLKEEKISLLYLRREELIPEQVANYSSLGLKEIFQNEEVFIYRLSPLP